MKIPKQKLVNVKSAKRIGEFEKKLLYKELF